MLTLVIIVLLTVGLEAYNGTLKIPFMVCIGAHLSRTNWPGWPYQSYNGLALRVVTTVRKDATYALSAPMSASQKCERCAFLDGRILQRIS